MRPVVLIPGIGGSIMVQKGNEHRRLFHKSVPNNRWVNIYVATKHGLQRWKKDMKFDIVYDSNGKIDHIVPEVPLYPFDFGGTRGVKDMVPEFLLFPSQYQTIFEELFHHRYFHFVVEKLHGVGYEDRINLFGAPYDFRFILDPHIRNNYFAQLQNLFEHRCARLGEKAVVVTHSLGGIMFKWFISSHVTQDWIDNHIEKWVCISAPFGGSYNALYAATSGDHYISSMRASVQPELQRNMGIISCFPNDLAFDVQEPLLTFPDESLPCITIDSYAKFSKEGILPFKIWNDMFKEHLQSSIKAVKRVPTHVVCGSKRNSTQSKAYADAWDTVPFHIDVTDGDGVVPLKSLLSVEKVLDRKCITETIIKDTDHTSILSHEAVLKLVQKLALKS